MPRSQGLFNNSNPELNKANSYHIHLGLPKGLFPVGLPVKILKELLPSPMLAT